jgi:beta-glucosidase
VSAAFPPGFLWGAATAAHQVEGNNLNNDWWRLEQLAADYGVEPSGDALDSYHRYPEDMRLLAEAGFTSYRFSIEWARIEPLPGAFSRAELAHYRRMIDTALGLGLTPVVTLHHFTHPAWFGDRGAWLSPTATEDFARYVEKACSILDGVEWVVTINEPNVLAITHGGQRLVAQGQPYPEHGLPDQEIGDALIAAHHAVVPVIRRATGAKVGWTVANQALTSTPGNEASPIPASRSTQTESCPMPPPTTTPSWAGRIDPTPWASRCGTPTMCCPTCRSLSPRTESRPPTTTDGLRTRHMPSPTSSRPSTRA